MKTSEEYTNSSKSKWIPVSERVPKKVDDYIVQDSDGIITIDCWDNGFLQDLVFDSKVIAWQPLPEQYNP